MTDIINSEIAANQELWPLRSIERTAIFISIASLVAALIFHPTTAIICGLFSGTLVAVLNFRFIRRLVSKMLDEGSLGGKSRNGLRFFVKMIILIAVVGALIFYIKVNPLAFIAGFSSIVLAIFYQGFKELF